MSIPSAVDHVVVDFGKVNEESGVTSSHFNEIAVIKPQQVVVSRKIKRILEKRKFKAIDSKRFYLDYVVEQPVADCTRRRWGSAPVFKRPFVFKDTLREKSRELRLKRGLELMADPLILAQVQQNIAKLHKDMQSKPSDYRMERFMYLNELYYFKAFPTELAGHCNRSSSFESSIKDTDKTKRRSKRNQSY